METFLTRLVMRTLGLASGVQPLLDSWFAPGPALAGDDAGNGSTESASLSLDSGEEWPSALAPEAVSTVALQGTTPRSLPPDPIATPPTASLHHSVLPTDSSSPDNLAPIVPSVSASEISSHASFPAGYPQPSQAFPDVFPLPPIEPLQRSSIEPSADGSLAVSQHQEEALATNLSSNSFLQPPSAIAPQPPAATDSVKPAVTRAPPTSITASLLSPLVADQLASTIQPQLSDNHPPSATSQISLSPEPPRDPSWQGSETSATTVNRPVNKLLNNVVNSFSPDQSVLTPPVDPEQPPLPAPPAIAPSSATAGTLQRLIQPESVPASQAGPSAPAETTHPSTVPSSTAGETSALGQSQPTVAGHPIESTLWQRHHEESAALQPRLETRLEASSGDASDTIAPVNPEALRSVAYPEHNIPISSSNPSPIETPIKQTGTQQVQSLRSIQTSASSPNDLPFRTKPLTDSQTDAAQAPILLVFPAPISPASVGIPETLSRIVNPAAARSSETGAILPQWMQPDATTLSSTASTSPDLPTAFQSTSPHHDSSRVSIPSPSGTYQSETGTSRLNPLNTSPHPTESRVWLRHPGEDTAIKPRLEADMTKAGLNNDEDFSTISIPRSEPLGQPVTIPSWLPTEPSLQAKSFPHIGTDSALEPISPALPLQGFPASTITPERSHLISSVSPPLQPHELPPNDARAVPLRSRSNIPPQHAPTATSGNISQRFLNRSTRQIRSLMEHPFGLGDSPADSASKSHLGQDLEPAKPAVHNRVEQMQAGLPQPVSKSNDLWPAIEPRLQEEAPWLDSIRTQHRTNGVPGLSAASPSPTVQVKIGRIEVRRVTPPAPPPSRSPSKPSGPTLSLEDYLQQRNGGNP